MTDKKIRAVRDWQSTTQVRQLLDLVNYHKRSIQDFAIVGKPINYLLVENYNKEDTNNQKKKTKNPPKRNSISSKTLIVWNQEH